MNEDSGLNEQFVHVSKIVAQYYKDTPVKMTEALFDQWIEALEEPLKTAFAQKGFEDAKDVLPFRRFAQELNDDGLRDYMRRHLNKDDFAYYMKTFENR